VRRSDRQMTEAQVRELLQRGEYGILSLVDSIGNPYGVPLNYVALDGNLYLHAATEGKKLQCIEQHPQVCFTVVGETEVLGDQFSTRYESVMAFGPAVLVETGPEKITALTALVQKYSADFIDKGRAYIESAQSKTVVIRITPTEQTGKKRA
jgi:uncharacterized protein